MELRSDIAAAAARMTSAYDVNREIRHLAAYLREGETVRRLASGVYGAGAGLLAVTSHRVLLLRDGRSGQASEGFPVERLSSAEWVVDGGRGTITVSDSNSVAELREVPFADGEEVVGFVRALMNRYDAGSSHRWPGTPAAGTNGNGRALDAAGPYTSPSMPRVPVPPLNIPRRAMPAATTTFSEGAVPVTLLSRPSTIPSQQPSSESSAPLAAARPAVARRRTEAAGTPAATMPSGTTPSASAAVPQGMQATSPAGVHAAPPPEAQATATAAAEGTRPPITAFGTASVAAVNTTPSAPVHMIPGYPDAATPSASPAQEQVPTTSQPTLNGHGRHSDTIGVPSMFAGEVPVSQLAAEETATQVAVPPQLMGDADAAAITTTIAAVGPVGPVDAPEKADAPLSDLAALEEPAQDGGAGERPQPIIWRVPDQTVTGAVRRIQAETAEAIRPPRRREAKFKPARAAEGGPKKWVWLGVAAATLVTLVAVGGTKLLSQRTEEAAPVNPAPAAVDSPAGPKATVTKVLDGDTVEVAGSDVNGTVEVLGIVAPRLDKNQCGAAAAKAFATRTLENTPVTLVSDPSQPATSRTGHRLAFLRLPNGSDYSVLATQEGMTRFYDSPQAAKMASDIKAAEAEAQGKHIGLWGAPCNLKPSTSDEGSTSTSGGNASPARTSG